MKKLSAFFNEKASQYSHIIANVSDYLSTAGIAADAHPVTQLFNTGIAFSVAVIEAYSSDTPECQ